MRKYIPLPATAGSIPAFHQKEKNQEPGKREKTVFASKTLVKYGRWCRFIMALAVLLLPASPAAATEAAETGEKPKAAAAGYVLMEPDSGKIICGENMDTKMYPAGLTRILTALIAAENIKPDEIITVGKEINALPLGSGKAGLEIGEAITGENLIRGILLPSGGEAACVAAMVVAKKVTGDESIAYGRAEREFTKLMNAKAREAGAANSNFVNPHGYHEDNHTTTVKDMAFITRKAMKNDIIRKIAKEPFFKGTGASPETGLKTVEHSWTNKNELITGGTNDYPYATGLKNGFTNQAGDCLAATASKGGTDLIFIALNSPILEDETHTCWPDAIKLFDYAFDHYAIRTVQDAGQILGAVEISRPRLGDINTLDYVAAQSFPAYLSLAEQGKITWDVTFDANFVTEPAVNKKTGEADHTLRLKAPLQKGQVIGTIAYSLDGETLYAGDVLAARDVWERTFNTDVDFYVAKTKEILFAPQGIPFWALALGLMVSLVLLRLKMKKKKKSVYSMKKRY